MPIENRLPSISSFTKKIAFLEGQHEAYSVNQHASCSPTPIKAFSSYSARPWETCTPYFKKRNIHFYVNKCGFQIDQFWCEYFQPKYDLLDEQEHDPDEGPDEMFRFINVMNP